MIIDSNLILFENKDDIIKTATGDAIALNSLLIPGKAEPIPIMLRVKEDLEGATSVAVKLQQADSETGTYADVSGASLTIAVADFKVGKRFGWRFLPRSVTKPWLKLSVTVTGTATAGKLFACISGFEDEPYEDGMYIDKGVVEG